jgi:hypothetical protein
VNPADLAFRAGSPAHMVRGLRKQGGVTILDVFDSLPYFRGDSWGAWRAFLAAVYGLPMTKEELAIFRKCTGRTTPPERECTTVVNICGRRAGKSLIDSTIIGYESVYRDYEPFLQRGERAYFPIIAMDKKGARTSANYVKAFLASQAYAGLVDEKTIEDAATINTVLHFKEDPITIEIFTASYRATRGYTIPAALGDEIAFWWTSTDAAQPDVEILKAVRGGMLTIPNAKTLLLSSPYAEEGVLFDMYERYYGSRNERAAQRDRVLVWKAPTTFMNPSPQVALAVAEEVQKDAASADAEYGANFRKDVIAYVSRDVVRACTMDHDQLPPWRRHSSTKPEDRRNYHAFVDVSGGSQDAFALSIAHWNIRLDVAEQDLLLHIPAPCSPKKAVKTMVEALQIYGVTTVTGDAYGGEWPREQFGEYGISYVVSSRDKHDIYKELMPALNSRLLRLVNHPIQTKELQDLKRKPGTRGRDIIDHPPGGHDDAINAGAGALLEAYEEGKFLSPPTVPEDEPETTNEILRRQYRDMTKDQRVQDPDDQTEDPWI